MSGIAIPPVCIPMSRRTGHQGVGTCAVIRSRMPTESSTSRRSIQVGIHAKAPYNTRGTRNTLNSTDGIYNSLSTAEKAALTLQTSATTDGYAGVINLGVKVG